MPVIRNSSRRANGPSVPEARYDPARAENFLRKHVQQLKSQRRPLTSRIGSNTPSPDASPTDSSLTPVNDSPRSWKSESATSSASSVAGKPSTEPTCSQHSATRTLQAGKADNSPRREPPTAFMIFCSYLNASGVFIAIKEQHEVLAKAVELWKQLDPETRKTYDELAEVEKRKILMEEKMFEMQTEMKITSVPVSDVYFSVFSSPSLASSLSESSLSSGEEDSLSLAPRASSRKPSVPDPSTNWWHVDGGYYDRTINPISEDPFFPRASVPMPPSFASASSSVPPVVDPLFSGMYPEDFTFDVSDG